jgi:type IV pilus assembly protein PilA
VEQLSVRLLPTCSFSTRQSQRGFTLIELMVVVVIIAILAVIAVPLFAARFDERRLQQNALRVAELYRGARTRALGRGAAIVVRKIGNQFSILEGVQGATAATAAGNAACGNLPTRGCLTNDWENLSTDSVVGTARVLDTFELGSVTTATTFGGTTNENVEVCFSPGGQTWIQQNSDGWTNMNGAMRIKIQARRTHDVVVLPNGSARLGL